MIHLLRAPSNIALIKYMGKSDAGANLPENASLSMTLSGLATWASVEARGDSLKLLSGAPENAPPAASAPKLSSSGIDKVLAHCARVRDEAASILPGHGIEYVAPRGLELKTANTFPEASGIASSASSFAAVTLAVALSCAADAQGFARAYASDLSLRRRLARLSRRGSGSSCRSFEGPWVLWEDEDARATSCSGTMPELRHFVLLISSEAKGVSSSEAHARVKSSPLWAGRGERVARRLQLLSAALERADLAAMARLAWSEAWEMHSLFHTCAEPFSYWKPGTIEALHWLSPRLKDPCPPIVTMDAGPNVHVTVPLADAALWRERFVERFGAAQVLEDRPGSGAEIVS